jgi:hypothetical protein
MLSFGEARQLAVVMLFCGTLFAQQYQGHDHTVFHRVTPAPAASSKHTPTASTKSVAHTPLSNQNTTGHASDAPHHHEVTVTSPPAAPESHSTPAPQLSPKPKY